MTKWTFTSVYNKRKVVHQCKDKGENLFLKCTSLKVYSTRH